MATKIVNQGLQRVADTVSQTSGYNSSRYVRTLSIDDGAVGFVSTHTALNSGGAIANEFDQAFDSTPSRIGQTVTHVSTIGAVDGNFTIKRIALHDDSAANVTTSSSTLFGGIDGQSLTKTADFTMELTVTILYSDAS
jgi:hypothetical protein